MKMHLSAFAILALLLIHAAGARAEIVERIVAIVNDEIVTQSDLNKYLERIRSGGLTDDVLIPDEATKEALLKDRDKLLQKMIEERVIDSEVKKQNLTVTIEKVEQEIRDIAKKNNVSREELKTALQDRGITMSQYQDFIKTGLERHNLIAQAVNSKIKISEDEVMAIYSQAHGEGAGQAYEYTLSHILFLSDKGGAAAAKGRAQQALDKLRGGANFEKLAGEASEDPAFEQGGLLGVFKTGELQKELENIVLKLNAGEYSGILPSRGGFHIVKLNKKRYIPDPQSEKERDRIRASLYEKAFKRQMQTWLEQLRQEAFVRINPL